MNMKNRKWLVILLCVLLAAVLTGCGSQDAQKNDAEPTAEVAAEAAEETKDTVDYTFGTDTAFRPFEYTDETGTLVGIDCWPRSRRTRVSPIRSNPSDGTLPLLPARRARRTP
jgi:hypothetical protein